MFGKKGFIRTMEAVLAIFLLLGLILYIFSTIPKNSASTPKIIEDTNSFIINELTTNNTFRSCIINTDTEGSCNKSLENIKTTFQNNIECKDVFSDFILRSTPLTASACFASYPKLTFLYSISPFVVLTLTGLAGSFTFTS